MKYKIIALHASTVNVKGFLFLFFRKEESNYAVSSYISMLLYSKFRLITFQSLKIKYTNVFLN